MTDRADVAAYFHKRMADDNRFGYTQGDGRWGSSPVETWSYNGVNGIFAIGDRDCSSSVIDCWSEALRGSAYENALANATYTGNMRSVFVSSGLFDWHPRGDGYIAQRGDIYLNENEHTALCQSAIPDMLTEALINEFGRIVGGAVGDQTGCEFVYRGFWEYPWDGILAYNHKADDAPDAWGVCMWHSHGGDNQRFYVKQVERGTMFICKSDQRALDVSGGEPLNGAKIIMYKQHEKTNQCWQIVHKGDSNSPYEIVSALDHNYCLDVSEGNQEDGAGLILWPRNGGKNQEWYLLDNGDGTVTIVNNGLGPKMVVDCVGGGA